MLLRFCCSCGPWQQWDLVCERRVLYASTQAVVMGGNLARIFLSGYITDMSVVSQLLNCCFDIVS